MTPRNDFSPAGMLFKSVVAAAGALVAAYLLWKLRSLIVPVAVSSLMAYICRPLVTRLEHHRVPRGLGIWLLLFVFVLAALFIANQVRSIMPTEIEALELKVRAIYKINEGYKNLMGLDPSLTRGNWIYRLAHDELDPIVDQINRLLALTPEEHTQFLASHPRGPEAPVGSDRLLDYYRENLQTLKVREPAALPQTGAVTAAPPAVAQTPTPALKTPIAALGHILSTWIIAPPIFLFLLWDTGEIKRGILRAVPNRLFEPALTVLADLDRALGDYMRGIFLECALLGLTVTLLLPFVGVSPRWAIAIGIFAGATNMIPYLGSAVALMGGLAYAALGGGNPPASADGEHGEHRDLDHCRRGTGRVAQERFLRPPCPWWCGQASSTRGSDRGRGRRHPVRSRRDAACDTYDHRLQSLRLEHSQTTQSLRVDLNGG